MVKASGESCHLDDWNVFILFERRNIGIAFFVNPSPHWAAIKVASLTFKLFSKTGQDVGWFRYQLNKAL